MASVIIALLFFIISNAYYARECHRLPRDEAASKDEVMTTVVPTTLGSENEELEELIKSKTPESAAVLISKISKQASESRKPIDDEETSKIGLNKAYACSKLDCPAEDKITPVCACNFNTGNVASFKNKCDAQKHNCRFDTNFKVILDEICPWEFAFRRNNKEFEFDYGDPKYYN